MALMNHGHGTIRKLAESMSAREAALNRKSAAFDAAIAKIKQLPTALGKETSQYIAAGVRASIQDDFIRSIAEAVKGPIAKLSRETYHAKQAIAEVARYERFQTWTWLGSIFLLGCLAGGAVGYYAFFVQGMNQMNDRLDAIQHKVTAVAPAPVSKPGTSTQGHHLRRGVAYMPWMGGERIRTKAASERRSFCFK
ncbi:hypothetical protein [Silvibacterium sp.]|uniref:hypothetical protein n=1 Tax=Silvibacterium sp. TaxID=1964179 RepID=UPI0039E66BA6